MKPKYRENYSHRPSTKAALGLMIALAAQVVSPVESKAQDNVNRADSGDNLYYSQPIQTPDEQLQIIKPDLSALISIDRNLDPFQLDASGSQTVSLEEVLKTAISRNLDISITQMDTGIQKWTLAGSYGKFLPTAILGFNYQYIKGNLRLPFGAGGADTIRIDSPFIIAQAGFRQPVYRGGTILFTALQNRNNYRASKHQYKATINDTLYEATRRYYDLLQQEALLQIRIKSVATSKEQVSLNKQLELDGLATRLEVLQAESQLSQDQQDLIDQQIARRRAAVALADFLNADQFTDLLPADTFVKPRRLVSDTVTPAQLLSTSVNYRPELKRCEELRLAAKKGVVLAAAPLQPQVNFTGNVYGIGETLSDSKKTVVGVQNLTPISLSGAGAGAGAGTPLVRQVSRQISPLYTIGLQVNWNLEGLGTSDLANIAAAKLRARQALLRSNKEYNTVVREVRDAFLTTLGSWRKIEEAQAKVVSSAEELRLAQLRLQNGIGRNIDVLRAQQDYTSAQVERVRTICEYNISQAALLRATGIISRETLLTLVPINPAQ